MSAGSGPINDYSPEESGQTLGALRPWGAVNALAFGDGSGVYVMASDMTAILNALKGKTRYDHTQAGADTSWVINHGLGNARPIVMAFDSSGREIQCYKNYETATPDSITLTMGAAVSGTSVVYSIPLF